MDISCKVGPYHLYIKLWGPYKWPKKKKIYIIYICFTGVIPPFLLESFHPSMTGFWAHLVCSFAMMTTISRDLAKMHWVLWVALKVGISLS